MQYYEVLVASMAYHGTEALTYSSETPLQVGTIVRVGLREQRTLGIIVRHVPKPSFAVKPVLATAPFPPVPAESLSLLRWLYEYYPAPLGSIVRQFVPPTDTFPQLPTAPSVTLPTTDLPSLTAEQTQALRTIQGPGTFVLHGITGSGKSRVYIELAKETLQKGKSAIVLTPEIGLTAQLTATFAEVFGSNVYTLHSQQTAAERRNIWYALLSSSKPVVVLGPRSALFAPVHNLGLIVLDEAHDDAYKNESAPHYQAVRVGAKLADLHKATLVLGSATPDIEDYYLATAKNRPVVELVSTAKKNDTQTQIEVVDLRKAELFSRNRFVSDTLVTHIANAMKRNEQSLIFLNRRGTANAILCNNCGWQAVCPHCDLPITYHADEHLLRCHVCGFHTTLPTSCPVCQNTEILFKSAGTKAIVDSLQKLFPAARIQRFDTDAKKSERLEQHLSALKGGSADIIVGTQMITKGLDLPKLSVVGIINADGSLLIPDYTAAEKTYQQLSQVIGRVGRGHRPGTVVIQSYDPENTTLHYAIGSNWGEFYKSELLERQTYHFPPFSHLLKLRVLRATNSNAEKAAASLAEEIRDKYPGIVVDGPAPSFHPKERGKYSWQLLVKSPKRSILTAVISELPSGWNYDIDPINLL